MMRLLILLVLVCSLLSCKSEIERLRVSTNVEAQVDKAFKLYEAKKYGDAIVLFEAALPLLRGNARQEEVYFKYAYAHFYADMFTTAAYYFKQFSNSYTLSDKREEADFMSAYCNYNQSPQFRLDQKPTFDAIEGLEQFVNTYPNSPRVEECNKLIDELRAKLENKAFEEARLYYDMKEFPSAITTLENLLKDFPETPHAEEIRFLAAKSAYQYATNSILLKQQERFEEFQVRATAYLKKHPKGDNATALNEMMAQTVNSLKELRNVRY